MLPDILIHSLISADGKIEGFRPEAVGLYYRLAGLLDCDTCLVGCDTLLAAEDDHSLQIDPRDQADEPLATIDDDERVLLVVPDSRGRLRNWQTHIDGVGARGAVALISRGTPRDHVAYLEGREIPLVEAGDDHVDYRMALAELRERFGAGRIRTDSGGVLNNVLLAEGLATELSLLISPELVGGEGRALFRSLVIPEPQWLRLVDCQQFEPNFLWLRYEMAPSGASDRAEPRPTT